MADVGILNVSWQGALVLNFGGIGWLIYRMGRYSGHIDTVEADVSKKFTDQEKRFEDQEKRLGELEKISIAVEIAKVLLEMQKLRSDIIDLMSQGRHALRGEMQRAISTTEEQLDERIRGMKADSDRQILNLKEDLDKASDRFQEFLLKRSSS